LEPHFIETVHSAGLQTVTYAQQQMHGLHKIKNMTTAVLSTNCVSYLHNLATLSVLMSDDQIRTDESLMDNSLSQIVPSATELDMSIFQMELQLTFPKSIDYCRRKIERVT
jgi:hypothetical protein